MQQTKDERGFMDVKYLNRESIITRKMSEFLEDSLGVGKSQL